MYVQSNTFVRTLIVWMVRRAGWLRRHPLSNHSRKGRPPKKLAWRYQPFLHDEIQTGSNNIYEKLPWWTPCNILLHQWLTHDDGKDMHDHPRWSITICLRGQIVEKTPLGGKTLKPGMIVFRGTRYIHGFQVMPEYSTRTWTLFIVGRRKAVQNTYIVTRQTPAADRKKRWNAGI